MTAVTTMTQKGQVTVPAFIREKLGLKASQKILFTMEGGHVCLRKAVSFLDLGGSLKTNKPFNIKAMKKASKEYVARRYLKSH